MESQMGEKHIMFSYISNNTFIRRTNFPIFQVQLEGGYNPLFTCSNLKEGIAPGFLWLQLEGGYNPLIIRLQPEGSSNSMCSPAPNERGL
jgi:hypothetical protein